ncbi:MAG: D-2-hydroxyacid dehydrogenase [Bacteroidota bacterium]
MEIVILDGHTLNPGDLSWDKFRELGSLKVYERTLDLEEIVERSQGAQALIVNKVSINNEIMENLRNLRYIGVSATGYDIIDIQAASQRGITVTNVPGYSSDSVAQHVFALLLEMTNRVGLHAKSTSKGEWSGGKDWSYVKRPIIELSGKTIGIVGLGNIGKKVAHVALALGMNVLAFGPRPKEIPGVKWVKLVDLFQKSDVISLHCPLIEETADLVDAQLLGHMKPTAYLINTSRGGLINEADLAFALNERKIAGAGLDVLSHEPPESDNPLLDARKCFITPHNAWASVEARTRLLNQTHQNLASFLADSPTNVVSRKVQVKQGKGKTHEITHPQE